MYAHIHKCIHAHTQKYTCQDPHDIHTAISCLYGFVHVFCSSWDVLSPLCGPANFIDTFRLISGATFPRRLPAWIRFPSVLPEHSGLPATLVPAYYNHMMCPCPALWLDCELPELPQVTGLFIDSSIQCSVSRGYALLPERTGKELKIRSSRGSLKQWPGLTLIIRVKGIFLKCI